MSALGRPCHFHPPASDEEHGDDEADKRDHGDDQDVAWKPDSNEARMTRSTFEERPSPARAVKTAVAMPRPTEPPATWNM